MTVQDHPQGEQALANCLNISDAMQCIDMASDVYVPDAVTTIAPDVDGLAYLLAALRRAKWKLDMGIQLCEDALAVAMPDSNMIVEGLGAIQRKSGAKRTAWRHDELVGALINPIAQRTGLATEQVYDVIATFRCVASPSWKTTGMRDMGLDPEEYCDTTWGRNTVLTPPIEEGMK